MSPLRPMGVAVAVAVAGSSARRDGRADREDRSSSLPSPSEVERAVAVETAASSTTMHTHGYSRPYQELRSLAKQQCRRGGRGAAAGGVEGVGGGARGGGREAGGVAGRPGSRRRYCKSRLSSPEVDEGTCGVGRVSWSLD